MNIPKQLQCEEFEFTKPEFGTKKITYKNWQNDTFKHHQLNGWNGNVGLMCGRGDILVIDADNHKTEEVAEKELPPTLTHGTCSDGKHYIYKCKGFDKIKFLAKDYGEIRANGQVLIPPSVAKSKKTNMLQPYKVIKDLPIAEVTDKQIIKALAPLMKKTEQQSKLILTDKMPIPQYTLNLIEQGADAGSRNKTRYMIVKDLANIGYTKEEIAEQVLKFNEKCKPSDNIQEVLFHVDYLLRNYQTYLKKDLEWNDKFKQDIDKAFEDRLKIQYHTASKILAMNLPKNRYIVDKLIPEEGITIIGGKANTYKSWLSYAISKAILTEDKLWGTFETTKKRILIIDEENTMQRIQRRLRMVFAGNEDKLNDLVIVNNSLMKINDKKWTRAIEELIEATKPTLVFVDTMARIYTNLDENSATDINNFFQDCLKPLIAKYKISFVLLHHDNKSEGTSDDMSKLRGSSEIGNFADSILKTALIDKNITNVFAVYHAKARDSERLEPMRIRAKIDDDSEVADFVFDGFIDSSATTLVGIYQNVIQQWASDNDITEAKRSDIIEAVANIENKDKNKIAKNVDRSLKGLVKLGLLQKHQQKMGFYVF